MVENRKGCVLGTRKCDPADLAQVIHCVTAHGHHGMAELSSLARVRRDKLTRIADGLSEEMPLRVALQITELQRDTRIVEEFARRAGGVFVPLDARDISDQDIRQAFIGAARELGQDGDAIEAALAAGIRTEADSERVCREIDETIAQLTVVKARVRAMVPQGPTRLTRSLA